MSLPLVMVPGSLCDERLFAAQVAELETSVSVAPPPSAPSIGAMAADVLAGAPARFALAGLSLGGIVAAEIVRRAPERVAGLALVDTNLAPPDDAQLDRRARWAEQVPAGGLTDVAAELVAVMTVDPDRHGALIIDMAQATGPTRFLAQNEALRARGDLRPGLRDARGPILVACGAEDVVCPPAIHRALAESLPAARLEIVDGAGHLSTLDQPAALTAVLAGWLEACSTHHQTRGINHETTLA